MNIILNTTSEPFQYTVTVSEVDSLHAWCQKIFGAPYNLAGNSTNDWWHMQHNGVSFKTDIHRNWCIMRFGR